MSKAEQYLRERHSFTSLEDFTIAELAQTMEEYALACLEKAAERMELYAPRWKQLGNTEESRYYECPKPTITDKNNLV